MSSLQDQLLKAGLVDQKKAKALGKEKRKQAKQQPKGHTQEDEAKLAARKALEEKSARDRELNQQRQAEADRKAIQAQIQQLISINRIDRQQGEVAYQFADGKTIKKLYVTDKLQQQLGAGQIAIVRFGGDYQLIPAAVADKIRQRDESAIVLHNQRSSAVAEEDDPYADYQIPDDLMW
ncbi:DUF2058 domain-containing protein [Pseudomaricurvus sp. HS19]|uniref:DUF2058 domain-containing protein n=1 Tax=Pseudomaricurvus sp. HS19 TaxID=2692626 RepID=UPI00137053F5|nr:DUF2058 domain-containing protein [Pseudomaricurvus sp. HS19]MYM63020.1 DUF2058 family protein [Pseudomaricurvus sp. HS19]